MDTVKLVVAHDVKIKSNNFEEEHSHDLSHEEANIQILHQVLASIVESD